MCYPVVTAQGQLRAILSIFFGSATSPEPFSGCGAVFRAVLLPVDKSGSHGPKGVGRPAAGYGNPSGPLIASSICCARRGAPCPAPEAVRFVPGDHGAIKAEPGLADANFVHNSRRMPASTQKPSLFEFFCRLLTWRHYVSPYMNLWPIVTMVSSEPMSLGIRPRVK